MDIRGSLKKVWMHFEGSLLGTQTIASLTIGGTIPAQPWGPSQRRISRMTVGSYRPSDAGDRVAPPIRNA